MISKQDHILQTALELFATEGLAVPTAKIAKEAGVANGTLFNYFPTKQGLIDALYLNIKKEVVQEFQAGGGEDKAKGLKERSFVLWDSYIRWSIANPLKHKVTNMFMSANIISPSVLAQVKEIFKPFHELMQKGIKQREIKNIDLDSLCQIKVAQVGVSIDQALARNLKGKALETHIFTSFDIYWNGVSL
jgi:AcrR family transcriptional regulator